MIKREDLNEKMLEVIQQEMQAEITKYSAEVTTMTMEQLNSEEAKLVEIMNEYDNYLNTVSYELEDEVEYEDNLFNKAMISEFIQEFVGKMEVEWQFTLGMYQMHKLWESIKSHSVTKIGYKEYDSTLRVLGQVKYKGYKEWESILAVNKYLSSPQEQYSKDNIYTAYLAELHNQVINQMNKLMQADSCEPDSDEHAIPVED